MAEYTTQYSRISHHTIALSATTSFTGATFTIPGSEEIDENWTIYDLALSEIGVDEFREKAYIRIGSNIKEFNLGISGTGSTIPTLNQVLTAGNTTGGKDIEMSYGDKIFSDSLGYVNINTHKISNTTTQLIGATLFSLGFSNGSPLSNNIDLSKTNSFTFYVQGLNTGETLGYYGELKVAMICDALGNITQIGIDDLYEVSDFTTVTINSNFISATQMNLEVNGEAGETINFEISWRRI